MYQPTFTSLKSGRSHSECHYGTATKPDANEVQDSPSDPFTALAQAATQMHELHLSYVAAGFTPDESIKLLAAMVMGKRD